MENEIGREVEGRSFNIPHPLKNDFMGIAGLASDLLNVPYVLMIGLEEEQMVIKATIGLSKMNVDEFNRITPSSWIPDARVDPSLSDHPWVTGAPHIRFCAEVPIVSSEGIVWGRLWVLDAVPREFDFKQRDRLNALASVASSVFECRFQSEVLRKHASLTALGKMAASIAHEINSPLTVLHARSSMLAILAKGKKLTADVAVDYSEKMLELTHRISKIILGISGMISNHPSEESTQVSLLELIEDALLILKGKFIENQVRFEYEPENFSVQIKCRPVQISQVILNLLNNAVEALESAKPAERVVKLQIEKTESFFEISVVNLGPRISTELSSRIFRPFFTTKGSGRGMGLGLSISREIMQKHGGDLTLKLASSYTTFILRVPNGESTSPRPGLNH